eukprot:237906-Chlamydomonas_euryale.AAC.1
MPVAAAAAAGSLTVTEAEVRAVLVEAPGGTRRDQRACSRRRGGSAIGPGPGCWRVSSRP